MSLGIMKGIALKTIKIIPLKLLRDSFADLNNVIEDS